MAHILPFGALAAQSTTIMPRTALLVYLSAVVLLLLLFSVSFVSRGRKVDDSFGTEREGSIEQSQHGQLKRHDDRTLKEHHEYDDFQPSRGTVRVKKVPLSSSDSRKREAALDADHRERGKSSYGYQNEGRPKGGKGKSGGSSDSSRKGKSGGKSGSSSVSSSSKGKSGGKSGSSSDSSGKGKSGGKSGGSSKSSEKGKEKKSKYAKECSAGKEKRGKGSAKAHGESASSVEISCADYDFLTASSTTPDASSSAELEGCSRNVLEQAHSLPELSTFVQMVGMAGLTCMFHCGGPFTLLAPTNSAFAGLNPEAMLELLRPENLMFLQELIMDHVLPGIHKSTDISPGPMDTLLGQTIQVETEPLSFGNSDVVTPDIMGCNGVVHVLSDVLIPSDGKLSFIRTRIALICLAFRPRCFWTTDGNRPNDLLTNTWPSTRCPH
jgi:uncharacterized surface protein with fasciclin (FAS1) repeats